MAAGADDGIRIGVSACLLGQRVRYDGGHKHDDFVTGLLGKYVTYVPVCPEVEIGLGVPRETLRLVADGDQVRMVGAESGVDHTQAMRRFAKRKAHELVRMGLEGYVFKKNSPSCGMERVRVYSDAGMPLRTGRGLYADELMRASELLPCEEEGRLNDPRLRESFVERVFAHHRLRRRFSGKWSVADLIAHQASEKLLLMAHRPEAQRELGRLVAAARTMTRSELQHGYESGFMRALATPATTKRNVNVLQHALGYFKKLLDDGDRRELITIIEQYRSGLVPLVVPITLVRHHVRRHDVAYLSGQTYLEPHPSELMLRNHI